MLTKKKLWLFGNGHFEIHIFYIFQAVLAVSASGDGHPCGANLRKVRTSGKTIAQKARPVTVADSGCRSRLKIEKPHVLSATPGLGLGGDT